MARFKPDPGQINLFDRLTLRDAVTAPRLPFKAYSESGRRGEPGDLWTETVMAHSRAAGYPTPDVVQIQTAWDRRLKADDAAREIATGTL